MQYPSPSSTWATLPPEELLTPEAVASLMGISVKTLATWRSTGRHNLPYIRCGSRIRYRISDVNDWLLEREHFGPPHQQEA
ncbi:helix-turn-helix domain-containing protein [Pseudomonas sp. 21LCFQ010]|uniref:helix-turn-helix domain-containing protein n=1 Tax=Pseudomonas sp. 21LCFQ010 TaxID=2957506 RepID=UPI0020976671|nr:helix-turn-helix domain-containing protein [Pseudomonas sp. 21LCFQ010]MCO8165480.1 helix-turn-helix domain-containing protein [Pseudomonas sp. 21LCFQ010]